MGSIDSPEIILTILANKGRYPGDPPVRFVLSYINFTGQKTYAITDDASRYAPSRYCRDPVLLMKDGKLTIAGDFELLDLKERGITHTDD